jgi:hypothetical protein
MKYRHLEQKLLVTVELLDDLMAITYAAEKGL